MESFIGFVVDLLAMLYCDCEIWVLVVYSMWYGDCVMVVWNGGLRYDRTWYGGYLVS